MNLDTVIKEIKNNKKLPNLKFEIKERTEAFTKHLFYTLFDDAQKSIGGTLVGVFSRLQKSNLSS